MGTFSLSLVASALIRSYIGELRSYLGSDTTTLLYLEGRPILFLNILALGRDILSHTYPLHPRCYVRRCSATHLGQ